MKNYKYPHVQWIARAMGILMIITAIITVMIPDVSVLQITVYHHDLKQKWRKPERAAALNANDIEPCIAVSVDQATC